ncbi:MAG: right-handed parallel beta-helix repeat-containing protein [Planctomycetes bacterium]|nr:right-handed parallel beta-helix repeat-containing protein [Planctomycetota bacterium]MCB9872103.1 right-handed parallel beta-helix repeat-containing protein [Planctomycetota bacterium]
MPHCNRLGLSLLLVATLGAPTSAQSRIYVDAAAPTSGDGSTWAKAFPSLQSALSAAGPGAAVWVAQGTYSGGFTVPASVTLVGGFRAGDTRVTQRDVGDNATILDGGDFQRVLVLGNASVVDGFFVQRGRAGAPGGGGALCLGGSAVIRNCGFLANNITAGRGSALYVGRDSSGRGADPLVENSLFVDNGNGTKLGHAIDVEYSAGTFRNVTVDRNRDNGLHLQNGCTTRIVNSTFTNNSGRGVCHIDAATQPTLSHCHFFGNTIALLHYRGVDYTQLAQVNALSYATNNIEGDPRYTDPSKLDYSLQPNSPLIDAGTNVPGAATLDVDGNSRWLDGKRTGTANIDIGPIEFSNLYLDLLGTPKAGNTVRIDSDGATGTPMLMAVALQVAATPFFLPQLGFVHADLGTGIVLGWANVGTAVPVAIPNGLPAGTAVVFQGVAGTATWGNSSDPLDVRLQ